MVVFSAARKLKDVIVTAPGISFAFTKPWNRPALPQVQSGLLTLENQLLPISTYSWPIIRVVKNNMLRADLNKCIVAPYNNYIIV